jgi:hypothetical protein
MGGKTKPDQSRCTNCREWFQAHASAQGRQRTCSLECRKKRLRALAKRRRERDLDEHREQERKRQRRKRLRAASGAERSERAGVTGMSRSGLSVQLPDITRLVGRFLDIVVDRSRAGLQAELRIVLEEFVRFPDRPMTAEAPVTLRPPTRK